MLDTLDWPDMLIKLLGGLALFLYGMELMSDGLKAAAGERMKTVLAKLTANRFMAAATGALVTAVIQSSSITTVLVVGFITANLMTLSQAVGVILGANVGTTITAQIVAFKATEYALPILTAGFAAHFFSRDARWVLYGRIVMGLGLIFFGMGLMGDGMRPLRSFDPFVNLMLQLSNPFLVIVIAASFTALVQSSSATTGIVIVMASQGLIPLETGIALIFGANIGTCVTAVLAAIGKPRNALRAALVHVLFNVLGVLLWYAWIPQLAELVVWLSPVARELDGVHKLSAEVPRQIANAHTLFNVVNTLLFLLLARQLADFVQWLLPEKPLLEPPPLKPRYLDAILLDTPALALDAARREVSRVGSRVDDMLQEILPAIVGHNAHRLDQIEAMDNEVDALHRFIIEYLGEISKTHLSERQTAELMRLMEAVNDLENVGDLIETNLVAIGRRGIAEKISISEKTQKVLEKLQGSVSENLRDAIRAVVKNDRALAEQVMARKRNINDLVNYSYLHQAERLVANEPGRVQAYRMEIDMIERFHNIYYHAKRVAKAVAAISGEAKPESGSGDE